MVAETLPSSESSAERRALDAWLNPFARTGERRIMGPAACDLPTELGRSAIDAVSEVHSDPDEPLQPNRRYVRYTSDENGWSIDYFSTDSDGNIIVTND